MALDVVLPGSTVPRMRYRVQAGSDEGGILAHHHDATKYSIIHDESPRKKIHSNGKHV
jgi:hypothetical protein